MPGTFTCQHCGHTKPRNPRLKKKQKYCSSSSCQQARMRDWKKKRYHNSKTYREKNLKSQRLWREQRPSHQYQQRYRETHPEYVERNRKLQLQRNIKRKKSSGSIIVNGNTLSLNPIDDVVYKMIQVTKDGKIVNGNTLLVQMLSSSGSQAFLSPNSS